MFPRIKSVPQTMIVQRSRVKILRVSFLTMHASRGVVNTEMHGCMRPLHLLLVSLRTIAIGIVRSVMDYLLRTVQPNAIQVRTSVFSFSRKRIKKSRKVKRKNGHGWIRNDQFFLSHCKRNSQKLSVFVNFFCSGSEKTGRTNMSC